MKAHSSLSLLLLLAVTLRTLAQSDPRSLKTVGNATTGKRTALVIGNATYVHAGTLRNPLNDAQAMSQTLQKLGFAVTQRTNLDRAGLESTINTWGKSLGQYEVALFYYAGHGIEAGGTNYLVPIDAHPQNQAQVKFHATPLDMVTGWMEENRVRTNIVLLDACRDNPFARSWSRSTTGGGLANITAPSGTFIGFAASPGKTAADGDRTNGLYTEAILQVLNTPDLTIDQIFNRVNQYVRRQSGGTQIPFKNSSLEDDFYFTITSPKRESEPNTPPITRSQKFLELPFADLVYVPGGTFQMGDTRNEGASDEKPVHSVTVSPFLMGKYEVTQRQWEAVMGSNPSHFKDCPDCPVELVSWDDVQEFLQKLNARASGGLRYRLPTEAEWEYAAGGGPVANRSRFGNGKDILNLAGANFDGSTAYKKVHSVAGAYRRKTVVVGSFSPNGLGLHDMSGNVEEWCSDWYGSYSGEAQADPTGPADGNKRVLRGGCWNLHPAFCQVAYRHYDTPRYLYAGVGFRVVAQLQ
ncbi:SUMF1/EgtB/PvdO family nonheme iron enzyme [Nibrella viscosa]